MKSTRRVRTQLSAALIAALAIAGTTVLGGPAQAAAPNPKIYAPAAFDAPAGGKGGIMNPVAACANYRVEPRMRWVLTNVETGESTTYRWTGSLPGYYFPRLYAGTYESETTAWCRGHKAVRHHTDTIVEKTEDTTISRAEFRSIRDGMTPGQVRTIVGYGGWSGGSYDGWVTRSYDMMPFWRWADVTFHHGHVVDKYWNVAHD